MVFLSKKITKRIVFLLCITAFNQAVIAQKSVLDSILILRDNRSLDVYSFTNNVVYVEELRPEIGFATANYKNTFGEFRQPMHATSSNQYNLATGGFKKINNWGYNGYFSYQKSFENDVSWNGVYNAYDDNPFIWADSSKGDWQKDEIKAIIGIIPPKITNKLSAGLQIEYMISSGARLSEPKPFYRFRNIGLQPALSYQLPNNQALGITGTIGFVVEENELGFYNNINNNVLLYRIRGYGTFSKSPFVSGERKRVQNDVMGTIHYRKTGKDYQFLIAANTSQRNDDVTEGVALPQSTGFFTGVGFGGLLSFYKGNSNKGKSIKARGNIKNGYADDVIFGAQSASSSFQDIDIKASTWSFNENNKTLWQFTISPSYHFIDNTDQATRTQLTASKVQITGEINYRKQLNSHLNLNATVETGYHYVLDDSFTNKTNNTIIRNLIVPNYLFYASNFMIANAKFGVDFTPKNSVMTHTIFITNQSQGFTKSGISRTNIQFNYSIIF
ncbi:MAG: hypothetical protein ACI9V1_001871 [Spirosomataceae bacterium]|jgi:hypothetical protein